MSSVLFIYAASLNGIQLGIHCPLDSPDILPPITAQHLRGVLCMTLLNISQLNSPSTIS